MRSKRRLAAMTIGVGVGLTTATISLAQDNDNVTEVVVTGSRIQTIGTETPTPVTVLSIDELRSTGNISIGDVLNELPALRGTFTSANSTRFIGTAGVNFLDLRGLGVDRTLVLVNGRRHVSASDGTQRVDTNSIPSDLLERVEQITGGASSIYGSDAVAGVVNFVLKRDFEGLKFGVQTGQTSRGDNDNTNVSLTAGKNFLDGRANLSASIEYGKERAFQFNDRTFLSNRAANVVSSTDPTGQSSDGIPDRTFTADTRSLLLSEGGTFVPLFQSGATASPGILRPQNSQARIFNFASDGTLNEIDYGRDFRPFSNNASGGTATSLRSYGDATPDIERGSLTLLGTWDVTDAVTLFTETKFVRADTVAESSPSFNQRVSASPANIAFNDPRLLGLGAAAPISLDNPFLTNQARNLISSLLPAGATGFSLNRNNLDLGVRGEDTTRDTSRIVLGVKGDITDNLNYEVSLNYGRTDVETDVLGNRLEDNFQLAVDAARAADGSIVCRSQLNAAGMRVTTGDPLIDNCVPVNLFGLGNVSDAARSYINSPSTFDATIEQEVASGFLAYDTSAFFELPGGPIGIAAGLEYRKESSEAGYSADVVNGLTFLNAIQPLDKDYSVKEVFAEVRLPVLKDLPGVEELTFTGSTRYADYTLQNTDTTDSWTAAVQYAPIQDITFRATTSKAVRAPNIGDLFDPLTQNFATVRDPCDVQNISQGTATRAANCAAAGVPVGFVNNIARAQTIEIRSGGNSSLIEEEARSITLGAIIQPRFVPGLSLTIDYYDIEINDVISAVTPQQILDNCYDAASLNNIFCPLIFRDPSTSLFFQNGNGPIGGGLQQSGLNFAAQKARGIDAEINYTFQLGSIGRFNTRFLGTYVRQRDNFPFVNEPDRPDQLLEELGDPKYQFNWSLGFNRGPLTLSYEMRWLESQYVDFIENIRFVGGRAPTNPDFTDRSFTGSIMYHDVRVGYRMNDQLNFYVGVDNLTDREPPLGFTGAGAGSGIYPAEGQFIYGGLNWKL